MSQKYKAKLARSSGISSKIVSGGVGEALLLKMGWNPGEGLGKNKDGVKECVQVAKKSDKLGVGAHQDTVGPWDDWWSSVYNKTAQKTTSPEALPKKTSKKSRVLDLSSDEEKPSKSRKRKREDRDSAKPSKKSKKDPKPEKKRKP